MVSYLLVKKQKIPFDYTVHGSKSVVDIMGLMVSPFMSCAVFESMDHIITLISRGYSVSH